MPLSILTAIGAAAVDALPVVTVSSPYYYEHPDGIPEEYRVLSDDSGNFILEISLDKKPKKDENILVYYRTVDNTAVAEWGDYEAVGGDLDAYVTLNKSNDYKARVVIKSTVIDEGFRIIDPNTGEVDEKRIITRKFLFELTRVEGDAVLYKANPDDEMDRDKSECYCYLKAKSYQKQKENGRADIDEYFTHASNPINTPKLYDTDAYEEYIQIDFPDSWKEAVSKGYAQVGIAINGSSKESWYNSDGYANLILYYTYQGKIKMAFELMLEGEMDDSTYYGWQHAYAYFDGTRNTMDRLDEDYGWTEGINANVGDFIKDNFTGVIGYNADWTEYYVEINSRRDYDAVTKLTQQLQALLDNGNAFRASTNGYYTVVPNTNLVFMTLYKDYVLADKHSYRFESQMDDDKEWRNLENVHLAFAIREIGNPEIKVENGVQMVNTNIDQLKAGDSIRMTVRFTRPVYSNDCSITAYVNGKYPVTLKLVENNIYGADGVNSASSDTWVFEGYLPEEAQNVLITHLEDIEFTDGSMKSFFSSVGLVSTRLDDIGGFSRDLRAPVATVDSKISKSWTKSQQVDIGMYALGTTSTFNDYVTVYYQWSNSAALPKSYGSSMTFHIGDDGDMIKTIIGTGNGEMYLHIKSVSIYGKETVSDMVTGVYDPEKEGAEYTPFGPFKFDNEAPTLMSGAIAASGSLKERTITVSLPQERHSGTKSIELYYIAKDSTKGEGTLLKEFTPEDFKLDGKKLKYTISHVDVGVGVDADGNPILERQEIEFYWVITDNIGNSSGKTAKFKLVFDSFDHLEDEILSVGPYDPSTDKGDAQFKSNTTLIDELTYMYDYSPNSDKKYVEHSTLGEKLYFGFAFQIDHKAFGDTDNGTYSANVTYKGEEFTDFAVVEEKNGFMVVWFYTKLYSGRYEIQLARSEGDSTRVSRTYTVYVTNGEDDITTVKNKLESGTLLNNTVYQLSTDFPYFYYKDQDGNRIQEYYNSTKQPATFSSMAKAKEYVYYKELSDIYLVQLTTATANALNSGTTGYIIAKGENATPQAGQYWIRYKSESWTPTSGDSSWVYYYYGVDDDLSEDALSLNLKSALNTVANRIVGYGRSVILTDTSLFLGTATGDKMLDKYGMPYLLEGQIHNNDEMATHTACGNAWSMHVYYAADKNIYKSNIYVGDKNGEIYEEFAIVGNFVITENSRFQYMTYDDYNKGSAWKELNIGVGEAFIDVFTASGVYYIRELSDNGIAIYSIYIDKEAPKASFFSRDENGNIQDIPVDGVEILEIRTKDLFIGSISATEYDRLSYVSVYRTSNLSCVGTYTANELDESPVKLEDGNYYIVVSDRSGNHYVVTAKVSSTDLECEIKETTDKFIRLTCNRRADQITIYEVYLNGDLITSTYVESQTFDKAGVYTINIQDIYGNNFSEEHIFTRKYPDVTWKYFGDDGKYHAYDPTLTKESGFIMTKTSENQYKISTSVKMRFSFSENYEFEFVGTAPEYDVTVGTETMVTIEEGQSFTLKISYKNHKDCYTTYSGVVDVTAPTINVLAEVDVLQNGEYEFFEEWIANGTVGDVIEMSEIYYVLAEIGRGIVTNGGTVSSDIIKIDVSDANELSLVEVYLNGELIEKQDIESGFSQIVLSRWGEYRIVAKDTLCNTSEFAFTNGMPDNLNYFVDGAEKKVELHGYLNFDVVDGKHVYNKVDYGKSEFKIDVKKNADVFISLDVSEGEAKIYGFRIADGVIYPLMYKITVDKDENALVSLYIGEAIIDSNAKDFNFKKEYKLTEDGEHAIYAAVSTSKVISLKVYAPENTDEVAAISARIEFFESYTAFVSTEISQKRSEVYFKDLEDKELAESDEGSYIRANDGFVIDEAMFADERISGVSLYYSKLNDLNVDTLADRTDIYKSDAKYTSEGFYLLVVRNLYGNERVYKIAISRGFGVTASVTFGDGHKVYYSKDHSNTLYSNNEIVLDIIYDEVEYAVTLNGERYNDFVRKSEDGVTYLIFSQAGIYEIKLTDAYGNTVTKQMEINNSSYTVADDLLVGFNENALKRDEGYTNKKLTVNKTACDESDIYYMAIKYGDKLNVLLDVFSEIPVEIDDNALINAIGSDGDGVYTLICRNRYGAVVTKEINYRGTPTLKLERTIRTKSDSEPYDLNYAISLGFWSNNTVSFSTEAQTYVFKINGNASECPRTLAFDNAGDHGSSEYDITYIDEYGFEYSFKVYLVRQEVTVELSPDVTGVDISGIFNTKDNVAISFGENMYATYTRNNGEESIYRLGDILTKDGTYRFTVMDYAGNASMLTIKKDTIVDFAFVEVVKESFVQNGGIVNSSKIRFDALNKDSAYIEKVIRDGIIQEGFTGSQYLDDGKWEFILSDTLGNKSYFCFYIVTRPQNGFAYTTPYEYSIKEMWYDSGDGVKISYLNQVSHDGTTSSFDVSDNGKYTVVMMSDVTGVASTFTFDVNTNAPEVSLVGCNVGETTINDVTVTGYKVGDRIKVYKITDTGEVLVSEVEVTSLSTKIPTVTEGGKYRIVVESEAGVQTELHFVRKHVMNTAGSVFIMIVIGLCVIGLFTGLVYRNKSKTDE